MTTTRAIPWAPSKRLGRRRSNLPSFARLLGPSCLAVALAACGGRSVSHATETDDGSDTRTGKDSKPEPGSGHASCEDACHECFEASLVESCEVSCRVLFDAAKKARCDQVLEDLLACRELQNTCNSKLCPDESNDLSVCISSYCDDQPEDFLCTAPI